MTSPTLFDAVPSPYPQKACPRCKASVDTVHRHRRREVRTTACPHCGALWCSRFLWAWAYRWCWQNVGLLRQAIRTVRCEWERQSEDDEIVSDCLVAVVLARRRWKRGRETKFSSWAANGVKLAAQKMPGGPKAKAGIDWNRVEGRQVAG